MIEITIAIPTYDRIELLEASLASALNQSYKGKWKVIICDNSDKNLISIARPSLLTLLNEAHVTYIHNEKNLGMVGNWNECINNCESEYITLLHDDDLLDPNFLKTINEMVQRNPGGLAYLGSNETFGDDRFLKFAHSKIELLIREVITKLNSKLNIFQKKEKKISEVKLFYGNPTNGSVGVTFLLDGLKKIGGYKESVGGAADWNMLVRLFQEGTLYLSNTVVGKYRYEENETLKPGVAMAFLEETKSTRKLLCDSRASNLKKYLFSICENTQDKLQKERYILIEELKNKNSKKSYLRNSYKVFKFALTRVFLRKILLIFSVIS